MSAVVSGVTSRPPSPFWTIHTHEYRELALECAQQRADVLCETVLVVDVDGSMIEISPRQSAQFRIVNTDNWRLAMSKSAIMSLASCVVLASSSQELEDMQFLQQVREECEVRELRDAAHYALVGDLSSMTERLAEVVS